MLLLGVRVQGHPPLAMVLGCLGPGGFGIYSTSPSSKELYINLKYIITMLHKYDTILYSTYDSHCSDICGMSRTIQTTKANHQTADGNNETTRPALEDPWELLSPWLMCGTERCIICGPCIGKPKSFLDPTALVSVVSERHESFGYQVMHAFKQLYNHIVVI